MKIRGGIAPAAIFIETGPLNSPPSSFPRWNDACRCGGLPSAAYWKTIKDTSFRTRRSCFAMSTRLVLDERSPRNPRRLVFAGHLNSTEIRELCRRMEPCTLALLSTILCGLADDQSDLTPDDLAQQQEEMERDSPLQSPSLFRILSPSKDPNPDK